MAHLLIQYINWAKIKACLSTRARRDFTHYCIQSLAVIIYIMKKIAREKPYSYKRLFYNAKGNMVITIIVTA